MKPNPKVFWLAVVIGWTVIGIGIVGVLGDGRDVPPVDFTKWLVGLALVHDLVVVPIVLAIGVGLSNVLGPPWRTITAGALIVAGPVLLFAWPYVQRWGVSASNPTIQPRDYTSGLVVVLAIISASSVLLAAITAVRRAQ